MNNKQITEYFIGNLAFQTERLIIRKIKEDDAPDMYDYSRRGETTKYLLWNPHPSLAYTRNLIGYLIRDYTNGRYKDLAIVYKENNKMIGTVGFTSFDESNNSVEIGYVISPDYWGMGIAPEAIRIILNFAFCELKVNRVEAKYINGNENSRRVMEKCDMLFEGIQRHKMYIKGQYRDIGTCSILSEDYFKENHTNTYQQNRQNNLINRIFNRF